MSYALLFFTKALRHVTAGLAQNAAQQFGIALALAEHVYLRSRTHINVSKPPSYFHLSLACQRGGYHLHHWSNPRVTHQDSDGQGQASLVHSCRASNLAPARTYLHISAIIARSIPGHLRSARCINAFIVNAIRGPRSLLYISIMRDRMTIRATKRIQHTYEMPTKPRAKYAYPHTAEAWKQSTRVSMVNRLAQTHRSSPHPRVPVRTPEQRHV